MVNEYTNSLMKEAWPWANSFSSQLRQLRSSPFRGRNLLFGSDYSGDHRESPFRIYAFVIADTDNSFSWQELRRAVRETFLVDGRRMAFKNLNDVHRRRALIPFLAASEYIEGHVIAVAVRKGLGPLSTSPNSLDIWKNPNDLKPKWDPKTFEEMARISHFFSLFLSAWSSPGMNVSWITDEDNTVANASRLDDMHELAARISSMYLPHRLGEFAMNTSTVDQQGKLLEDFLAIPDLAAGMLSEVLAIVPSGESIRKPGLDGQRELSYKSDIIADWFWHNKGTLKKTCILIDRIAEGQYGVGQLTLG